MMKDGHFIDDPLDVITAKPDFSDLGIEVLTPEDHAIIKKQDRLNMLSAMLFQIKVAINSFGENRSLGNVAANIEAIIKNMEK